MVKQTLPHGINFGRLQKLCTQSATSKGGMLGTDL